MARKLKNGDVPYTKLTHLENGNLRVRRIHRIEVQTSDGRVFLLDGDPLPDESHRWGRKKYIAQNLGRIHLSDNPQDPTHAVSLKPDRWLSRCHLVDVIAGLVLLMTIAIAIALAAGMF